MSGDQLFYIAMLGLFITSLTTSVVSPFVMWLVSKEQRRRDLEDRKLALETANQAAALARQVAEDARDAAEASKKVLAINGSLMKDVKIDTTSTLEVLDAVHADVLVAADKADASYKEANSVNLKIQALQDVLTTQLGVPEKKITETTKRIEEEAGVDTKTEAAINAEVEKRMAEKEKKGPSHAGKTSQALG